jgi:E3 ubiquitin-protein ligase BRE1
MQVENGTSNGSAAAANMFEMSSSDTELKQHVDALTRISVAFLSTVANSASASPSLEGLMARERQVNVDNLRLSAFAAQQSREIVELREALHTSNTRCKNAERLIERLKYDHPDLDIDAHMAKIAPHGMASSSGVGTVAQKLPVELVADTASMAPPAPLCASCSGGVGTTPSATAVNTPATDPPLAFEPDELELAREELDIFRSLADERLNEVQELREQVSRATAEIAAQRVTPLTEAQVVGSSIFLTKCNEMAALQGRMDLLETTLSGVHGELAAALQRTATAEARAQELAKSASGQEGKLKQFVAEKLSSNAAALASIGAERDAALAKLAQCSADVQACNSYQQQAENSMSLVRELQTSHARWRQDWCQSVAAAPAVAPLLERFRSEAPAVSLVSCEVASLQEEKAQLMAVVESVSSGYEASLAELEEKLLLIRARDAELLDCNRKLQQASAEKGLWEAARSALESKATAAVEVATTAQRSVEAHLQVVESYVNQVSVRDARIVAMQTELSSLKMRHDKVQQPTREVRMQIEEMQRQVALLMAQVSDLTTRLNTSEDAQRMAREQVVDAHKRMQQQELRIRKLKDKLLNNKPELEASFADLTPMKASRGLSAPAEGGSEPLSRLKEDHFELLRQMLECSVCRRNHKNVALLKCGHLFCKDCIDDRIKLRNRRCPACQLNFSNEDVKQVFFAS